MHFLDLNLTEASAFVAGKGAVGTKKTQKVVLQPGVLLSVIDHYLRRNTEDDRVIGTLLGTRQSDGTITEVRSSYWVPHFESTEIVEVDMEYHSMMLEMQKRVNPQEEIVGWYATSVDPKTNTSLIQDFYSNEVLPYDAILLVVDCTLKSDDIGIEVFSGSNLKSSQEPGGCMFVPIQHEIQLLDDEKCIMDVLSLAKTEKDGADLKPEIEQIERAVKEIIEMLDRVLSYVNSVVEGKVTGNSNFGRELMNMISLIPSIDSDQFKNLFHSHVQNVLITVYLNNLIKTQLNIADRILHIK